MRYNAVQYQMVLHTPLLRLGQNIIQGLNSHKTPHSSYEDFSGNWLCYNVTALYMYHSRERWKSMIIMWCSHADLASLWIKIHMDAINKPSSTLYINTILNLTLKKVYEIEHHCLTLRPSDAIWRQWSWTTLAQVMAWCRWLIIRGVLWHTSESSFAGIAQGIDSGYEFEKDILKNIFKSPRGQWVKLPFYHDMILMGCHRAQKTH